VRERCTLQVFRILSSQCHYVVARRPAAVARYFRRGSGPAIYANPLCWAGPIDVELRRDARTVNANTYSKGGSEEVVGRAIRRGAST